MAFSSSRAIAIFISYFALLVIFVTKISHRAQNNGYDLQPGGSAGKNESNIKGGQTIHFITYGNDRFAKSKKRIVQEALETGWFDTARAYEPEDLPDSFYEKDQYAEISALPPGGGYWLWEFFFFEQAMAALKEGDFLIWCDAGHKIHKDGEARFREYINMVNNSQYDVLGWELSPKYAEYIWTTQRLFLAYDVLGNASFTHSPQFTSCAFVMQKGPHFRKWMDVMYRQVLDVDPWLITDKYNEESHHLAYGFINNRWDQSVMSVAMKIVGCIKVPYTDIRLGHPGKPFEVARIKE